MVFLRLLVEHPVVVRAGGHNSSLPELGSASAFRALFRGNHFPCKGAYMMAVFQTHVLIQICSQLSGDAIEQISLSVGHTLAGLLNASFGNIIEIIVGITALLQGEVQIVQTAVRSLPSSVLQRMLIAHRCLVLFCTISSLCWGVHSSLVCIPTALRTCT